MSHCNTLYFRSGLSAPYSILHSHNFIITIFKRQVTVSPFRYTSVPFSRSLRELKRCKKSNSSGALFWLSRCLRQFASQRVMSHPEFSGSLFSIFWMPKPEESGHWEEKTSQELGESRSKDDRSPSVLDITVR